MPRDPVPMMASRSGVDGFMTSCNQTSVQWADFHKTAELEVIGQPRFRTVPDGCDTRKMSAPAGAMLPDPAAFRGELIMPDDPAYDGHRTIWNGSFDRQPALIIRCAGVADVIAAVKFGRASGLPVAVRSGGHSFPGFSVADDALLIDLSPMKGVRVDPDRRTARVQAGVLLGELDRETQAFGLAVPSGIVTHTGVAGLTLGGGIGWIMRKHGLSIDHLISVDLVTAAGEFVRASAEENSELFWGVRGGGGNFGIVTEFEFSCVPVGHHSARRTDLLADEASGRGAPVLPRLGRGRAG